MDGEGKLLGREILRVSYDKSGRERSNEEQQGDNRAAWPGWEWLDHYSDVGSASRYATKRRGDFDRLMADLRAERFGADVLVMWENSRGSRRVGEWVELIELCETHPGVSTPNVRIAVTTHHRVYDPANPRDRRQLIDDANDAEYESAKTSARAKRATAANAAAGRPHGIAPYGYTRTYDPGTGRLVGQEPDPDEAPVMAELFDRIARGHSLRSIEQDFAERGIRSRSGKVFSAATLRSMALRPLYAGLRSHAPGKMTVTERRRRATTVEAIWPAIVPKETFLAVQRILSDPARRTSRPGRAKWLLSMIALCDVCSGPMACLYKRGERCYRCHRRSCATVVADELEAYATQGIVDFLSRPDSIEKLTVSDRDDRELAKVREEIAKVRVELDELADQVGRGELSAMLAARAEPQIQGRLRDLESREQELATPSALRSLIAPGEDAAKRWQEAPMSAKRDAARLLLRPDMLGELRVMRNPIPGHRVPIEQRVTWHREQDEDEDMSPLVVDGRQQAT